MNTPILFQRRFPQGLFLVYDGDPHDSQLSVARQTHSILVKSLTTPELAQTEADGVFGTWGELQGKTVAVKTADCLPILFMGEHGAAMVHAGWRGLAYGILQAPELAQLNPTHAFVGPCIHDCCFEVTAEFKEHFPGSTFIEREGKLYFDLVAEARGQALRTFPGIRFEDSGECTCCVLKYSSFRRDKTTRRVWNCFRPLAE